jgi:hypothetical protein
VWAYTPGNGELKGGKVMATDKKKSPEVGAETPGRGDVNREKSNGRPAVRAIQGGQRNGKMEKWGDMGRWELDRKECKG